MKKQFFTVASCLLHLVTQDLFSHLQKWVNPMLSSKVTSGFVCGLQVLSESKINKETILSSSNYTNLNIVC